MLFGATECSCGCGQSGKAESLPFELSYWEALRAFWRVYWPSQLIAMAAVFVVVAIARGLGTGRVFPAPAIAVNLFVIASFSIGLYLFVPRVVSRPYHGFSIDALWSASQSPANSLPPVPRIQVSWFLLWRQVAGGWIAGLMNVPVNGLLSMLGGFVLPTFVAQLAGILVIGPVILRMLIGHQFADFRLEARRPGQTT